MHLQGLESNDIVVALRVLQLMFSSIPDRSTIICKQCGPTMSCGIPAISTQ